MSFEIELIPFKEKGKKKIKIIDKTGMQNC